jgi:hypothetical protein
MLSKSRISKTGSDLTVSDEECAGEIGASALYKEFLAERDEILRHKYIESEKAGYDVGFERALLDWVTKHRSDWRAGRLRRHASWQAAKGSDLTPGQRLVRTPQPRIGKN